MDIVLHYMEQGEGEPLLLLHGNGEDHTYFTHQITHFSKKYRVIAVDTRGHGESPRGTAPFTLQQFAEDLCCFMNAHSIEKANLLGFSDGGNIALIFALRHPERVDRLILNGANLTPDGLKPLVRLPILLEYCWSKLFASKGTKARKTMELMRLMVKEPQIRPDMLHPLSIPTLVVAGEKDMIKERHTRLIYKNLPEAKLAILPGDHFVANRNPKPFNQAVESFLEADY